jgi:transglutaminase/protease-like cytokinesis protein 3
MTCCCCCFSRNKIESDRNYNENFQHEKAKWIGLVTDLNNNDALKRYALAKNRSHFKSVHALADYLSKGPHKNNLEKAWLIYVWITENIAYDGEGRRHRNYGATDAESVLAKGKSVCNGYAELFSQLAARLKIECMKICGYAKGIGYEQGTQLKDQNHAWNMIKCSDFWWQYVDATWGAGYLNSEFQFIKRFQPYYFLTPADILIETHFCPSFPLHKKNITLSEFERLDVKGIQFYVDQLDSD